MTLTSPILEDLLATVRSFLNQTDNTNSFWSDAELTSYLNEAIRIYFLEVLQNDEGYFDTTTTLNVVTNADTVALPSDFFKMKALYMQQNGTDYVLLPYRNNVTESYSTQGPASGNSYAPYYYFRGNNIILRPTPQFTQTGGLLLEYTQFPSTLVDGGDIATSQISPIFRQVLEMYAVYKAKLKETLVSGNNVHATAQQHVGELVDQLRDAIKNRSRCPAYVIPFNPESSW